MLIPHLDDVACCLGANVAMFEAPGHGVISSGSLMVPSGWFPDAAGRARASQADLGIHLTLTSESAGFRWGPISTGDPTSGLIDPHGYMWPTVPEVRAHADPDAVEAELRAQIERALAEGVDVTHLDHHMGAAVAPEFVDRTAHIATDYALPILFPADLGGYAAALNMGPVDLAPLEAARTALAGDGLAVADHFLMGLSHQTEPDPPATLRRLIESIQPGTTYLSLHCAQPGEVEIVHPKDAHWRAAEFELFRDPAFSEWLRSQPVVLSGMREIRDELRSGK